MGRRSEPRRTSARYAVGFGFTATLLGGLTLVMVLVVLPRRYVLHAGLRESGVTFPARAAPFTPPEGEPRAAVVLPVASPPPPAGPAERFWGEVVPLLEAERYEEALPLFEAYLVEHPSDAAVRREQAITLDRAGHSVRAADAYAALLRERDEPAVRLLYARSLRDQGRLDEADAQYRILRERSPHDPGLGLEAARALAWGRRYDESARLLAGVLEAHPDATEVRVELARVLYWSGRLDEASELLETLSPGERARLGATRLHEDVRTALAPPPAEEPGERPPPTLAEQAARALAEDRVRDAEEWYRRALAEAPTDTALLRAHADVLQYRLDDAEGARATLLRLEELTRGGEPDPDLQLRLARLDAWTGRSDEARQRLERLLGVEGGASATAPGPVGLGPARAAEAHALLGNLYRWDGLRARSADAYRRALDEDPDNEAALGGLAALGQEVDRQLEETERPRLGTDVSSFADSDDFRRLDLALEGVTLDGPWVVGARTGSRVVRGSGEGGLAGSEHGLFADVELGRWWRWGTVRTAIHGGVERIRPDGTDVAYGASVRWESLFSFRTDLRYDHGPAYPVTVTHSSLVSRVTLDRVTLAAARQLPGRWGVSVSVDAGRLGAPADAVTWPAGDGSLRLEGGATVGRSVSDAWILGVSGRALTYTEEAPAADGRPLFWDPEAVVAAGVYAQWARPLGTAWELRGRFAPSLAFIDERRAGGFQRVPHLSAEGGLAHTGRVRTTLDVFYYQGRFDGYRAYGARIAVSARDLFGGGGR